MNGSVFNVYFAPEPFDWTPPGVRVKMVRVVQHLSVDELRKEFETAEDGTHKRHLHTILLLAEGATVAQTAREDLGELHDRDDDFPAVEEPERLARRAGHVVPAVYPVGEDVLHSRGFLYHCGAPYCFLCVRESAQTLARFHAS
ncbi:MAG TPA: hypothetical protein PKW32_20450 [Verrucomicrobiota bacterium]|nr:hypothetical protein [Verrucomicrobiota bacterium]